MFNSFSSEFWGVATTVSGLRLFKSSLYLEAHVLYNSPCCWEKYQNKIYRDNDIHFSLNVWMVLLLYLWYSGWNLGSQAFKQLLYPGISPALNIGLFIENLESVRNIHLSQQPRQWYLCLTNTQVI